MNSLMRIATSKTLTNIKQDNSLHTSNNPHWLRFTSFTLYMISSSLIIMSIRKIYIDRWQFFMILRSPLLTIFFIFIFLTYNIFNLIRYSFPILISIPTEYILFLTLSTLRISIISHTLYILFFAILQQYTLLHRLNLNNNIQRLLSQLIIATTSSQITHENIIRTIFIIYNLIFFLITTLLYKFSKIIVLYEYFLIITPQFFMLNVLTFLMYKYQPLEYNDMFNLKKQWNYIVLRVVLPLNIMLILTYLFPLHFNIIHSVFDLILLFKFTWSISTYPINLYLQHQRQLLSMQQPHTWQEFLCTDNDMTQDNIDLFKLPIDDAISYIDNNMNMFAIENNNVSPRKLEFFMREFGDPNEDHACVIELLFVTEISQIKSRIMSMISDVCEHKCGFIVNLPNGLPASSLLISHLQYKSDVNIDNIYDILARIYLKYINYDTATVPIYDLIPTHKLDIVYDLLTAEFPQNMCLAYPMVNQDDENVETELMETKNDEIVEFLTTTNDTQFEHIINNVDFNTNNVFDIADGIFDNGGDVDCDGHGEREEEKGLNFDFDLNIQSVNIDAFVNNLLGNNNNNNNNNNNTERIRLNEQELENIYKLLKTYDDILEDASIKIQHCYEEYTKEIISKYSRCQSII